MRRLVNAALGALVLSTAPASAQVRNALDRQAGVPAGLALPVLGVAAAEQPAGIGTTPAAAGFVRALAIEWFGEGGVTADSRADGVYLADGAGPLGVGYSVEWVRPGASRRYRRNALALALGDGRSFSLGLGWNRFTSPDPAIDPMKSWDAGLTLRPWRHLSAGAAMLGRGARLGGAAVPTRWDLGLATRLFDDAFTLSADLLADDRGRDDFHATHLAFGAGVELRAGIALAAQLVVPVRGEAGTARRPSAVVALSWNGPHVGITGGVVPTPEREGGFAGARVSGERYRASASGHATPTFDLADELRPRRLLFFSVGERDPYGLLVLRLAEARSDPEVAAVVVQIDRLPLGIGRIEELRAALAAMRERKPVLAYVFGGDTKEYWLATGATAVAMPPGSALQVNGIATSNLYLKDAFSRLGVAFDVVAAGAYKSAPEPLVRTGPSPEAREAAGAVLDDVFGRFVADVAAARRMAPEKVRGLVDQGLFSSEEARDAGLVDDVIWPDEIGAWMRRATGRIARPSGRYSPDEPRLAQRWGRPAVVEIVRVEGAIVVGKSRPGPLGGGGLAGAETVAAQLRRAARDRDVKAIVLRVESPGGDGLASDLIWREVVRARAKKPVVASMGDYAASGGYLVAVGADAIVAEPSTLTGSIGVFAMKPDLSSLLAKLSIGRTAYARGRNAESESLAKPWSASERGAIERQVKAFYRTFVERVAEGRKMSVSEVEAVAGGRVWTGALAHARRLVDRLGSLSDAIALARERAGLGSGAAVEVRRSGGGTADLPAVAQAVASAAPPSPLAGALESLPEVAALSLLAEMGPVVALPTEWVAP